jgi:hypothetical protein
MPAVTTGSTIDVEAPGRQGPARVHEENGE